MEQGEDWILAKVEVLGLVKSYHGFKLALAKIFKYAIIVNLRDIQWGDVDTTSYDILQRRNEIKTKLSQIPDNIGLYNILIYISGNEMKYFGTVLKDLNQILKNTNLCFACTKYKIGGFAYIPYAGELVKFPRYLEYLKQVSSLDDTLYGPSAT
jgi:hypothetical protein